MQLTPDDKIIIECYMDGKASPSRRAAEQLHRSNAGIQVRASILRKRSLLRDRGLHREPTVIAQSPRQRPADEALEELMRCPSCEKPVFVSELRPFVKPTPVQAMA